MATLTYVVKTADQDSRVSNTSKYESLNNAVNVFKGLVSGGLQGSVDVYKSSTDPVAATATITITHANVTNNDTTTIANTVITAATSGNGTTSWTIGADATADAVALAACVNANTTLNKFLVATSATNVVTLTCVIKGVVGNGLALATSDATAFALVAFANGAGGTSGAGSSF